MEKKKAIKAILVFVIIIAAGIGIMYWNKFQYSLDYGNNIQMEIYLGKSFEEKEIISIAAEIYGEEIAVQKASAFHDGVVITVRTTTDEQKETLINKMNEKYETTLTVEDIDVQENASIRGRDLIAPYVWVSVIAGILILAFFEIRYHQLGIIRILGTVIAVAIGTQILYLTLVSICNVQISSTTIVSGITILIFCFMYLISQFEKELR